MIRPVLEGAIRLGRRSVRTVSPRPPYLPEPHENEPLAPVYTFVPLGPTVREDDWIRPPRYPDPLVFGPPGSGELQRQP